MGDSSKTYYEQEAERIFKETSLPENIYTQVRQSKEFMEARYSEKVEIDQLAEAAFLSPSHYIRVFKKVYGVTPRQFLRDLRISKAKKLLSDGETVTDVCFAVGYESVPMFSSTFKRCTGCTPKQFQKIHKSNLE